MTEPEVVLEEASPHGNLEAIIEQDDRVAHLYLRSPEYEDFGLKTCWIRNLTKAPDTLDVEGMRRGIPPMLPKEFCMHPQGREKLNPDRLRIVWFPEGDGVALLEDDEMLAAIPSWSGFKGFSGYARDCTGQSSLCWRLDDLNEFNARISAAERFWRQWDGDASPWPACQDTFMAAYEAVLGPHSRYFAIDGGYWPPKALVRFDLPDCTYLLTMGISLRPQPAVEMYYEDPVDFRRFEFAACLSREVKDGTISSLASYLSGQSTLPWHQFTFFAHGHTIRCEAFAGDDSLRGFTSVLLINCPASAPELNPPRIDGERVSLLWTIPITSEEQKLAERDGSRTIIDHFPRSSPLHMIGRRTPITAQQDGGGQPATRPDST
ncbi:MAG: suppressor of fused domain protein [Verrucomicrobia bacterium]|nr:suppressor of fused domain protein [Verrucomicrobiota bacterium]